MKIITSIEIQIPLREMLESLRYCGVEAWRGMEL
jgi:hypothetical protein